MTTTASVRRPGVITFVAVLMYIQAILGAAGAVTVIAVRNQDQVKEATGQTGSHLLSISIIGLIIAVLVFVVATALLRGVPAARLIVAVVQGLNMAWAVVLMFIHHDGAYLWSGLITLLWGAFILWILYGNDRSEAYFEQAR